MMLPQISRKQKRGIITMLVSSLIRLTYEGIASFLHHKHNKALHQAVRAMDGKTTIQHNKLMQLEKFNVNVWHLLCRNVGKAN